MSLSPNAIQRINQNANFDTISHLIQIEKTTYMLYNYIQFLEPKDAALLESRRVEICSWMYRFVDSYDLCRDVVYRAMSYFDRFLMTLLARRDEEVPNNPSRVIESSFLQLASMTALNLAIKLYSPLKWNTSNMIKCSRGKFTLAHIISMERQMLHVLVWRVNPPTSTEFIMYFTSLVFDITGRPDLANHFNDIVDMATFFTELSVWDSYFLEHKSSTVAIASMLNATESLDNNLPISSTSFTTLFINVLQSLDLLPCEDALYHVQSRLQEDYSRSADNQDTLDDEVVNQNIRDDRANSPTSVFQDIRSNYSTVNTNLLLHNNVQKR